MGPIAIYAPDMFCVSSKESVAEWTIEWVNIVNGQQTNTARRVATN